jgi:hypothetical protein
MVDFDWLNVIPLRRAVGVRRWGQIFGYHFTRQMFTANQLRCSYQVSRIHPASFSLTSHFFVEMGPYSTSSDDLRTHTGSGVTHSVIYSTFGR